jgi:hypothetical protein
MQKKKLQRYGVGFGPALHSKLTGGLVRAANELKRLIKAGEDPRFLTIVPVKLCDNCKGSGEIFEHRKRGGRRPLHICSRCNGFKFVVQDPARHLPGCAWNFEAPGSSSSIRVAFMSSPKTTLSDLRTYMVRETGEPSAMVRVHPGDIRPGDRTRFATFATVTCDCPEPKIAGYCKHAAAVLKIDGRKFGYEITGEN